MVVANQQTDPDIFAYCHIAMILFAFGAHGSLTPNHRIDGGISHKPPMSRKLAPLY